MKLLHIIATPRANASNTLRISNAFLEALRNRYADLTVETLDLFSQDLPAVAGDNIEAKYTLMIGSPLDQKHEESWKQIESLIEHFLSADIYLISVPMWNFNIPYALKFYIDAIVQPGYLFKYNEQGQAIGLVHDKKMVCISTRGGDYSESSAFHVYDFQEPYLRAIFGFVGIRDVKFINAQPMDVTPQLREAAVSSAIDEAQALVAREDWEPNEMAEELVNPEALKPKSLKESEH
jgi:FMN-dependent NADH-azoreductase